MSYSHKEAAMEEESAILQAIAEDDYDVLRDIAERAKGRGEDEYAESLLEMSKVAHDNVWAYDRAVDNSL